MNTVKVKTHTEYDVLIGKNILETSGELIKNVKGLCKAAIISDDKVFALYGDTVRKSLEKSGFEVFDFVFPNGEVSKNIFTYGSILEFLAQSKITRSDIIIALGGGVVGDIAGFCAATYLRGIDFVQIPTSLLAAVDSSVGGKTAIDLAAGKNLAGAFHQPILVICDTGTFLTLDERQLSCGFAEVIKYAILCDKELFCMLMSSDFQIDMIVQRCISIKRDIVESDEFDNGKRKLLNLGHTLGHAVEKHSNYSLTHGEAVAVGMVMICRLSEVCGFAKESISEKLKEILLKYSLPVEYKIEASDLLSICAGDKKIEGADITPVIPLKIGECVLKKMPLDEFFDLVKKSMLS